MSNTIGIATSELEEALKASPNKENRESVEKLVASFQSFVEAILEHRENPHYRQSVALEVSRKDLISSLENLLRKN